jgi:hypothetical protein
VVARKGTRFTSLTDWLDHLKEAGAKGGKKRAAGMTKEQRSESARKAVKARWAKKAAAASAKVRSAKAKAKAKAEK